MTARTAKVVYWTAATIAGLIVVLAVASYFANASEGEPVFPIVPLLLAAAIWAVGYFCRSAFSGR
jgi:4-hydroxybenzoate polyprenyltransferase